MKFSIYLNRRVFVMGPGVSLTFCCFVFHSTRRFVLSLALCYVVIMLLFFSVLLALRLPHLGKRELILVLFVRLFDLRLFGFVCFLFLLGRAAACDCGTPWTFLLPLFFIVFLCLSLWCWGLDVDLIVSVPEFSYQSEVITLITQFRKEYVFFFFRVFENTKIKKKQQKKKKKKKKKKAFTTFV